MIAPLGVVLDVHIHKLLRGDVSMRYGKLQLLFVVSNHRYIPTSYLEREFLVNKGLQEIGRFLSVFTKTGYTIVSHMFPCTEAMSECKVARSAGDMSDGSFCRK